jgi:UDP:flavonoid glycosyltransferase YjiC (YdhE family)
MRITMIAAGTRGDAQPAIALGKALKAAGHQVRLVASDNFAAWVTSHGLEFAPLGLDIQTMMNTDLGKAWADSNGNAMKSQQAMRKLLEQHGWTMVTHTWEACQDAEAIISGFTVVCQCHHGAICPRAAAPLV